MPPVAAVRVEAVEAVEEVEMAEMAEMAEMFAMSDEIAGEMLWMIEMVGEMAGEMLWMTAMSATNVITIVVEAAAVFEEMAEVGVAVVEWDYFKNPLICLC
jgi:hypothetical protein